MKIIARIFAFIFAFLLVFSIPISLLSYDVGNVIFDPHLVKQVFTDIVTESDLIPVALKWFVEQRAEERYEEGESLAGQNEPDVLQLLGKMDTEDWVEVRKMILPNVILSEWVSESVDGIYEWIDNDERTPQISWSLAPVKERLSAENEYGRNAILIAYQNLEPCTEEEIADFESRQSEAPSGTEVPYNLCQFPGTCVEDPYSSGCDQLNDYVSSIRALGRNIPNKFTLTEEFEQDENAETAGPLIIKNQLRAIRLLMNLAPLIPLILLLLILLFSVRSLKGLGMWWGIPITLGSLITLAIALLYRPLLVSPLTASVLRQVPNMIRSEVLQAILELLAEIFQPARLQSAVALFSGIILVIIMIIAGTQETQKG